MRSMVPMTVDIIEAKSKFQWLMICRRKIGKNGHIVRDGYGIQENLQDGSVYEGMWREEQMCGTGRMTCAMAASSPALCWNIRA